VEHINSAFTGAVSHWFTGLYQEVNDKTITTMQGPVNNRTRKLIRVESLG
jgi:hypothetical protein